MARSGSENRQRQITLKARFTEAEAALVKGQAGRAGVSVAALIRYALLDQTPLRAARTPQADTQEIARLIGSLGTVATALRQAAEAGNPAVGEALIDAALRDLSEMRALCLQALGREP